MKIGDKIIYPTKIGGTFPLSYLADATSNSGVFESSPTIKNIFSIFHLDKEGKLIRFQGQIVGKDFNKTADVEISSFKDDFFQFSPAYKNGVNIPSIIYYKWHTSNYNSEGK